MTGSKGAAANQLLIDVNRTKEKRYSFGYSSFGER